MKFAGFLLIVNALAVTGWQVATSSGNKWIISVCLIAVFAGLALTFQDRLTELTIKGVGSLKAATAQAETKLAEIEQIRTRVEAQSATIDLVAKDAKDAKQLTEEIKKKSEDVEEKVKKVDSALEKATAHTKELSSLLDFTNTVVAAQNDDRKAFDRLRAWADDLRFPYAKEALQAWQKVMDDHSKPWSSGGFSSPWKEGFDPSKLGIHELAAQYAGSPSQLHPALLEYIWGRNDISKIARMDFMMEVMRSDSSLTAVEYAGRYFTGGADLKIKPVAVEYLYDWWQKNRGTIKE
jgi:hypothetical protein